MNTLEIEANRKTVKYSKAETLYRVLWSFGIILFRLSPRPCFRWRCWILRLFGAKVGKHVYTYSTTTIYFPWNLVIGDWSAIGENALIYNLGIITIGARSTISHGAHLCAGSHDYKKPDLPLLKPPITIKDQVWVCADAFVGPGVIIGEGVVVGARAVVVKNVAPWTVVVGNPARVVGKRDLDAV